MHCIAVIASAAALLALASQVWHAPQARAGSVEAGTAASVQAVRAGANTGEQSTPRRTSDLTGPWQLTLMEFGEPSFEARAQLESVGSQVSGTAAAGAWNELKFEGSVDADVVTLKATQRGQPFAEFKGTIKGNEITGTATRGQATFTWKASRPDLAGRPAQTHTFTPRAFHRVFSARIEPVLRIRTGDTVRTWTVDSGGRDPNGVQRSLPGNPQTGPFYVEGAMPGDALAITFSRIRLNRDSAFGGKWIIPKAITPIYFRSATADPNLSGRWTLDRQAGYAMLEKPTAALRSYRVPLRPMLGCVAVAPADGEAFSTRSMGPYGGNLDYNRLREGVTVYLPVFVPGALVFVGDGHAAQGDGELNGDALETSMEAEFSVRLIQNGAPQTAAEHAPRFEDAESLMASGISNSLTLALQRATTSLARWVKEGYSLSDTEIALVLGTAIEYDIAAVPGDQMHVVARVEKEGLAAVKQ